jgi:hypothetical protein
VPTRSLLKFIGILTFSAGLLAVLSRTQPLLRTLQSVAAGSRKIFEDDRIRVSVPDGWLVQPATVQVTGGARFQAPVGALLTKGRYKVYLISHAQQASGVIGGRFTEWSPYVCPWIKNEGWITCPFFAMKTAVGDKLTRDDLYFDARHATSKARGECANPSVNAVLWYGSYFVETCHGGLPRSCGSGFLVYEDFSGKPPQPRIVNGSRFEHEWQMIFSVTYDTKTPDQLPVKGNPELQQVLREATQIVRGIEYK